MRKSSHAERTTGFVKYLWMTSVAMTIGGVAIVMAGMLSAISPVAFVAGVLLFWSGLVKMVVLRIWRSTLASPPEPPDARPSATPRRAAGNQMP